MTCRIPDEGDHAALHGTQTRTFVYGGAYLTSATNPENERSSTHTIRTARWPRKSTQEAKVRTRTTPPSALPNPTLQPELSALRVKAGSAYAYIDASGQVWAADYGSSTGSFYTGAAESIRSFRPSAFSPGTLEYQFTVPNATYAVNLKFGEIAGAQ